MDIWLAELAVLLVFAVAALCSLRASRTPAHERLALVLFLTEICVVTPSTWNSRSADLRSFVEVYLMAVIVLLGRRASRCGGPGPGCCPRPRSACCRCWTTSSGYACTGPSRPGPGRSWLAEN